jgi:CBS domain containing-hemolysin-like protein
VTEFLVPVTIIAVLLLANALFVAAEFAIVGAPKATIEHQVAQGSRLARRVLTVMEDPVLQDRFIATTQIGISVASLGLGMYGEHWLAEHIEPWFESLEAGGWLAAHVMASVVAVAVLTYLHIVIGEMVPKTLALQRAHKTVLYVSPVIRVLERLILPLVIVLNAAGNGLLRLAGIERSDGEHDRYHTAEELEYIVRESHEGGLLRGESGQILRELFEFGDLTAGEVMVPRVLLAGVPVGATAEQLRAIVQAHPHTRYPVYDGDLDHIIGSLHIKEVLRHLVSGQPITARDARALPYVPGPVQLDEVLSAMRRSRAQMAVVMDQHGGTAGLVTMEDLFEEVVGEIGEGRARGPITRGADGRVRVRGTVRLDEAWEALGRSAEHPKVTTISGLVLLELGRPAAVGDVVTWKDVRIEVLSVAGRGVDEAELTVASAS